MFCFAWNGPAQKRKSENRESTSVYGIFTLRRKVRRISKAAVFFLFFSLFPLLLFEKLLRSRPQRSRRSGVVLRPINLRGNGAKHQGQWISSRKKEQQQWFLSSNNQILLSATVTDFFPNKYWSLSASGSTIISTPVPLLPTIFFWSRRKKKTNTVLIGMTYRNRKLLYLRKNKPALLLANFLPEIQTFLCTLNNASCSTAV